MRDLTALRLLPSSDFIQGKNVHRLGIAACDHRTPTQEVAALHPHSATRVIIGKKGADIEGCARKSAKHH